MKKLLSPYVKFQWLIELDEDDNMKKSVESVLLFILDFWAPMLLTTMVFSLLIPRYLPPAVTHLLSWGAGFLLGCYVLVRILLMVGFMIFGLDWKDPRAATEEAQ